MTGRNEKRMCTRTPFLTGVTLRADDGALVSASLLNISISGMLVRTTDQIPAGTTCKIEIVVTGRHSRLVLDAIEGQVVRQEKNELAIQFTSRMEWFVLFNVYSHYCRQDNELSGENSTSVNVD